MLSSHKVIAKVYGSILSTQKHVLRPSTGYTIYVQMQQNAPNQLVSVPSSPKFIYRSWYDLTRKEQKIFEDVAKEFGYIEE